MQLINPNRHGRSSKFSKKVIYKFESWISPQLGVPENRTKARLKGLVLCFHFGQVSLCHRAPLPSKVYFFSGTEATRQFCTSGACSNNKLFLGFVATGHAVEALVVVFFSIDRRLLFKWIVFSQHDVKEHILTISKLFCFTTRYQL